METVEMQSHDFGKTHDEEEGEILEDGEIDEEEVKDTKPSEQSDIEEETIVEEVIVNEEDEQEISEEETDQKKHRRKSHHRRRRRKHEDHKSDDKKSRHKKRKVDENSEGNDSPPSKRKKKRKKHSRDKKERGSTSPEIDVADNQRLSESPPLPSEQTVYNYGTYDALNTYASSDNYNTAAYDPANPYTDISSTTAYQYDSYNAEPGYSSGSDSCYSDFESHLKQYQSYKQNKDNAVTSQGNDATDDDDEDNYYSVGYDAEQRQRRRQAQDQAKPSRRSQRTNSSSNDKRTDRKNGKGDKYRRGRSSRKIPELCHQYLTGVCKSRDTCNYMHEDYPCKYFHTEMHCVNGDECKFSHDPPNEETKRIIRQFQDAYNNMDDSKEIEALEKVGIKPLEKPPQGKGLLPTPPASTALQTGKSLRKSRSGTSGIPSLFDITVKPTPELQQKIDANAVLSLQILEGEIPNELPQGPISVPPPIFDPNQPPGTGLLPLPTVGNALMRPPVIPNYPPPSILGAPPGSTAILSNPTATAVAPPLLPPGSATPPWILRQQALLKQEQEELYNQLYTQSGQPVNPVTATSQDNNQSQHSSEDKPNDGGDTNAEHNGSSVEYDEKKKEKEDVIRMDDHDVIKDSSTNAPSFLPAKQKALLMRIRQKGDLTPNKSPQKSKWDVGKESSADNWTYSSDEEDPRNGVRKSNGPSESVQSIIQMMSNKSDQTSVVDTNLLSKVATAISMSPNSTGSSHSNHSYNTMQAQSSVKTMMSPPRQPQQRQERKTSGNDADSPQVSRDPLRRRLSTSELHKEPVTIPLVAKQQADMMRTAHPDPRVSLSRFFGKSKTEFRATMPVFGKDLIIPGGKMTGLKITLSSNDTIKNKPNGDKRSDPRLSQSQSRSRGSDPRMKKLNDPRLRVRVSSTKSSPPQIPTPTSSKSPTIPSKPTALLTKPATSIIPSLPELNLDFASIPEKKPKLPPISPASTKPGDPLARLPKLFRANVRPASNRKVPTSADASPTKEKSPPIAPYDPRYIGANTTTTASVASTPSTTASNNNSAPYDPRVINSKLTCVPPALFDTRSTAPDLKKRTIQLPKLTPAPGYSAKLLETNGNLPTGEAMDF